MAATKSLLTAFFFFLCRLSFSRRVHRRLVFFEPIARSGEQQQQQWSRRSHRKRLRPLGPRRAAGRARTRPLRHQSQLNVLFRLVRRPASFRFDHNVCSDVGGCCIRRRRLCKRPTDDAVADSAPVPRSGRSAPPQTLGRLD